MLHIKQRLLKKLPTHLFKATCMKKQVNSLKNLTSWTKHWNTKPKAMRSKRQLTWPRNHSPEKWANLKRSGVTTWCHWSRLSRRCRTRLTPVHPGKRLRLQSLHASGRLLWTCSPTNRVRYPDRTSNKLLNSKLKRSSSHRPKSCSMKLSVYMKHSKCTLTIKSTTMLTNLRPEIYQKAK